MLGLGGAIGWAGTIGCWKAKDKQGHQKEKPEQLLSSTYDASFPALWYSKRHITLMWFLFSKYTCTHSMYRYTASSLAAGLFLRCYIIAQNEGQNLCIWSDALSEEQCFMDISVALLLQCASQTCKAIKVGIQILKTHFCLIKRCTHLVTVAFLQHCA